MISFSEFCIHVSCPLVQGFWKKRCCKREESLKNRNLKNYVTFISNKTKMIISWIIICKEKLIGPNKSTFLPSFFSTLEKYSTDRLVLCHVEGSWTVLRPDLEIYVHLMIQTWLVTLFYHAGLESKPLFFYDVLVHYCTVRIVRTTWYMIVYVL